MQVTWAEAAVRKASPHTDAPTDRDARPGGAGPDLLSGLRKGKEDAALADWAAQRPECVAWVSSKMTTARSTFMGRRLLRRGGFARRCRGQCAESVVAPHGRRPFKFLAPWARRSDVLP